MGSPRGHHGSTTLGDHFLPFYTKFEGAAFKKRADPRIIRFYRSCVRMPKNYQPYNGSWCKVRKSRGVIDPREKIYCCWWSTLILSAVQLLFIKLRALVLKNGCQHLAIVRCRSGRALLNACPPKASVGGTPGMARPDYTVFPHTHTAQYAKISFLFTRHRALRYVRYADDLSVYTKSKRTARKAGNRIYLFLRDKLKLPINREKSGIRRPVQFGLLGYKFVPTYTKGETGKYQLVVSEKGWERLKRDLKFVTKKTTPSTF